MKAAFLLLGILMLYVSCIPCYENRNGFTNSEVRIAATDHDQLPEQGKKSCLPFCTCPGCASITLAVPDFSIAKVSFDISPENSVFISPEINDIILSIWHPPQLAA